MKCLSPETFPTPRWTVKEVDAELKPNLLNDDHGPKVSGLRATGNCEGTSKALLSGLSHILNLS